MVCNLYASKKMCDQDDEDRRGIQDIETSFFNKLKIPFEWNDLCPGQSGPAVDLLKCTDTQRYLASPDASGSAPASRHRHLLPVRFLKVG